MKRDSVNNSAKHDEQLREFFFFIQAAWRFERAQKNGWKRLGRVTRSNFRAAKMLKYFLGLFVP